MTKNESYLSINGEYYDWVELYNPNSNPVLLSGFYISDDENDLFKYQLPAIFLNGNSHFTLICSSLNQLTSGYYHTNFALKNSEAICLSNHTGLIEKWEFKHLPANHSYGRINETQNLKEVLQFASPNGPNQNHANNKITTNHYSGYYASDFYITLDSYTGDSIYYTLNNYDPLSSSIPYHDSIFVPIDLSTIPDVSTIPTTSNQPISYHSWQIPPQTPQKCYSISYASYKNNTRTSPIYHLTFIPQNNEINFDIVSITADSIGLFSSTSGILVPGVNHSILNPEWTGNFFKEEINWERNTHFSFISKNGLDTYYQPVKIKIAGGKTRQSAQKSLAIQANEHLSNSRLLYSFFDNQTADYSNAVTLKTTMGDWETETMLKDIVSHEICKDLNFKSQRYKFVDVYINGVYFGVQSIRERFSPKNFLIHQKNEDSLVILNPSNLVVNYGSSDRYESITDYIANNDLSNQAHYNYISEQIDIDNIIDYYCAELFFSNYDWPVNNIKTVKVAEGKWQWLFFDLDAAFANPSYNMFKHVTNDNTSTIYPNPTHSTFLFRKLLENDSFKTKFIHRYTTLLHSTFASSQTLPVLEKLKNELAPAVQTQINRWGYPSSIYDWEGDVSRLRLFLKKRPCSVINNMNTFFLDDNLQTACDLEWTESAEIRVYPNPTDDFVHVLFRDQSVKLNRIIIYNQLGQIIQEIKPQNQSFHYSFSLNNSAAGTYILELHSNLGLSKRRIVKF